jgi:hypothetical protein
MTNNKIENIYLDFNGKIFKCLKKFLNEVLFPCPFVNLTALLCNKRVLDYMWSGPRI